MGTTGVGGAGQGGSGMGGSGLGGSGMGGAAQGGSGGTAPSPMVWQPGDVTLSFVYDSNFYGHIGWEGTYAQAPTALQLAINGLTVVPTQACWADNDDMTFTVSGMGAPRTYYASCPSATVDSCVGPLVVNEAISCDGVDAFIGALPGCRRCNGVATSCASVVPVDIDDGCRHGPGSEEAFEFTIPSAGLYTFGSGDAAHCGGSLVLKDAMDNVVTSWASVCPTVSHTFAQPGVYRLEVTAVPLLLLRSGP